MFEMTEMYRELGISEKVYQFGKEIEKSLEDRFDQIDKVTEFNQLKVIRAMQESRVNEACFNYASGYGYNDQGRDTLEEVYAKTFHTESALVRPQITCGTHALALALSANLRPGDERSKYHIQKRIQTDDADERQKNIIQDVEQAART